MLHQAMHLRLLLLLAGILAACRHAAAQQAPEAATAAGSTSSTNSSSSQPQVLIIGAGMAGVAAARELTDKGISVLLTEARDRAGALNRSSLLACNKVFVIPY
jgi:heterodisulfide reductase subunit A-like polyferredoxin